MIQSLHKYSSNYSEKLSSYIRDFKIENSFNPSLVCHENKTYIAFRGKINKEASVFEAFLIVIDSEQKKTLVNLSEIAAQYGVEPVADPKLIILDNNIWLSFNTGWNNGNNDIYLWHIKTQLSAPLRCTYKNRQAVEKNWGFFFHESKLFALYSLSDGKLLSAEMPTDNQTVIEFIDYSKSKTKSNQMKDYTIGTQPIKIGKSYLLIGHKKISILKKRLYLGKIINLKLDNESQTSISTQSPFIVHSLLSILGARIKHNKNLISCTYFSGLFTSNEKVYAAYGINDINFNIVELPEELL